MPGEPKGWPAAGPEHTVTTGHPLVLVADDCSDTREAYRVFLTSHGYRVAEAVDSRETVQRAAALVPAVVVLDLGLPAIADGWQTLRLLKSEPSTLAIPVLVLSGYAEQRTAALLGCDAFLLKPCNPDALRAAIARLIPPS
jgi:two-component system, cell cycle response regulator DivK